MRDAESLKRIILDEDVNQDALNDEYVKYFIKCLEHARQTRYDLKSKPDVDNRQSAQPDYLFSESSTGKRIAIEYTRIYKSEQSTKNSAFFVDACDERNIVPIFEINPPTASELGERLTEFFVGKLSKGQFNSFANDERILLCRNMWTDARIKHFSEAQRFIKLDKLKNLCDHIYVVEHVYLNIIEIF